MGLGRWGLAAVVGAAALGGAPGRRASRPAFFEDSRDLATARARATGGNAVLAARPGQSAGARRVLRGSECTVERGVASVDYVRVRVPTARGRGGGGAPAVVAAAG